MNALVWLVVIALGMGTVGLLAFLWTMRSGQLEDLDGAAVRVLLDEEDKPLRGHPEGMVERGTAADTEHERGAPRSIGKEAGYGKDG